MQRRIVRPLAHLVGSRRSLFLTSFVTATVLVAAPSMAVLTGAAGSTPWNVGGNSFTVSGTQVLGTTSSNAVQLEAGGVTGAGGGGLFITPSGQVIAGGTSCGSNCTQQFAITRGINIDSGKFTFGPNNGPEVATFGGSLIVAGALTAQVASGNTPGSVTASGALTAQNGATINGALTAQNGASITGTLTAQNNAQVLGMLTAQAGATINGALTAQTIDASANGLTVNGALTAQNNTTIGGALTAQESLTVNGALTAQTAAVSPTGAATVTANGALTAQAGATINGALTAQAGATVNGALTAQAGATINGALTAQAETAGSLTVTNTITGSVSGNAGTVTNGVYTIGDQTIGGNKTFSSLINGSISGNAGSVTNGVYTTGNQTIAGAKTFTAALQAGNGLVTDSVTTLTTGGSPDSLSIGSTGMTTEVKGGLTVDGSLNVGGALIYNTVNAGTVDVGNATIKGQIELEDGAGHNTALSYGGTNVSTGGAGLVVGNAGVKFGDGTTQTTAGVTSVGVPAGGPLSVTTGTTPTISLGTVGIANGGTGLTTGPTTGGQFLRSSANGTWAIGTLQAGDVPDLSSLYTPLNGTGATGTWGISINGNAATATTSTTAASATTATTANGIPVVGSPPGDRVACTTPGATELYDAGTASTPALWVCTSKGWESTALQ